MWCDISGEAAGEIWNWSLLRVKNSDYHSRHRNHSYNTTNNSLEFESRISPERASHKTIMQLAWRSISNIGSLLHCTEKEIHIFQNASSRNWLEVGEFPKWCLSQKSEKAEGFCVQSFEFSQTHFISASFKLIHSHVHKYIPSTF